MVFRILLIIAGMLVLVIMAGTIYGLAKRGKSAVPPLFPAEISGAESIFSNLGTMRIPTADPDPETLVISIAFPYSKSDRPFSEELASRISWFKTVTTDYLGAFTGEELSAMDESTINNELLSRFNSDLRLGQIKELYILEFMRL
jgi:flagellar basal body-associated protein FliL